jgi:ribonuclease D
MHPKIITNQAEFEQLIHELKESKHLAIDTEFDRRKTYFANLSLIQIGSDSGLFIVDILKIENLNPLKEILYNSSIVKIFHAAEQDLEIFYNLFKMIPINFFDTQIAASFCGFRKRIGYGELCKQICDIDLDKNLQNMNWLTRPISDSMIKYLASDVIYLKKIYDYFIKELNKNGKINNYFSAIEKAFAEDTYKFNPDNELKKIKLPKTCSAIETAIAKNLAILRNDIAMKENVPRKFIAANNDILSISLKKPKSLNELKTIRLESKLLYKEQMASKIIDIVLGQIE